MVDDWWGRPVLPMLPRLFLDHFHQTSLIAEHSATAGRGDPGLELWGFLVGLMSPADPAIAYVHFAGVAPPARRSGLATRLYLGFFSLARDDGRRVVRAVTSPGNQRSIAFHRALGFDVRGPIEAYDGPGRDLVCFERPLDRG